MVSLHLLLAKVDIVILFILTVLCSKVPTIPCVPRSAGSVCAADGIPAGEASQTILPPGPAQQGEIPKTTKTTIVRLKNNDFISVLFSFVSM